VNGFAPVDATRSTSSFETPPLGKLGAPPQDEDFIYFLILRSCAQHRVSKDEERRCANGPIDASVHAHPA